MKVSFVTPDPEQLRALVAVFRRRHTNLVAEVADNALFALTQLERTPPDLIVSAGDVGICGADFLEIVRDDPALKKVAFILLDETALERSAPGAHEVILAKDTSPAVVLGVAASLLGRARLGVSPTHLHGTTGAVSPFDLVTLFAKGHHTGRLSFALPDEAALWYRSGRLVHAEYGQFVGETAFTEMFRAIYAGEDVCFSYRSETPAFEASTERSAANSSVTALPTPLMTLAKPLELLLFETALELDLMAQRREG